MSGPSRSIRVLDKGFLRLVKWMGDDLEVINDAKASFAKEAAEFGRDEERLLRYLYRNKEFAPFRHGVLKFEWYAPLLVCAQIKKYAIACSQVEDQRAWSEASRRYITMEPEFYDPDVWRGAPANAKQGSSAPVAAKHQLHYSKVLEAVIERGLDNYNAALADGICAEQARMFLPAYGLYTSWRMTISLNAALFLLLERLGVTAQWETREYAKPMHALMNLAFPVTMSAFDEYSGVGVSDDH